jgi:hypothetical protein
MSSGRQMKQSDYLFCGRLPITKDELECSLVEASLNQGIEYNALPYSWARILYVTSWCA